MNFRPLHLGVGPSRRQIVCGQGDVSPPPRGADLEEAGLVGLVDDDAGVGDTLLDDRRAPLLDRLPHHVACVWGREGGFPAAPRARGHTPVGMGRGPTVQPVVWQHERKKTINPFVCAQEKARGIQRLSSLARGSGFAQTKKNIQLNPSTLDLTPMICVIKLRELRVRSARGVGSAHPTSSSCGRRRGVRGRPQTAAQEG